MCCVLLFLMSDVEEVQSVKCSLRVFFWNKKEQSRKKCSCLGYLFRDHTTVRIVLIDALRTILTK